MGENATYVARIFECDDFEIAVRRASEARRAVPESELVSLLKEEQWQLERLLNPGNAGPALELYLGFGVTPPCKVLQRWLASDAPGAATVIAAYARKLDLQPSDKEQLACQLEHILVKQMPANHDTQVLKYEAVRSFAILATEGQLRHVRIRYAGMVPGIQGNLLDALAYRVSKQVASFSEEEKQAWYVLAKQDVTAAFKNAGPEEYTPWDAADFLLPALRYMLAARPVLAVEDISELKASRAGHRYLPTVCDAALLEKTNVLR